MIQLQVQQRVQQQVFHSSHRAIRTLKFSKSPTRISNFQDPLQLTVSLGIASLQSLIHKLSCSKTFCNFLCPQGSQAPRVSETSFSISSFPATHRALSSHKLPDFITRPSELERTNYFLLIIGQNYRWRYIRDVSYPVPFIWKFLGFYTHISSAPLIPKVSYKFPNSFLIVP